MTTEEKPKGEAELKLKELYKLNTKPVNSVETQNMIHADYNGGVYIAAEHIDLIVNLVVERLNDEKENNRPR